GSCLPAIATPPYLLRITLMPSARNPSLDALARLVRFEQNKRHLHVLAIVGPSHICQHDQKFVSGGDAIDATQRNGRMTVSIDTQGMLLPVGQNVDPQAIVNHLSILVEPNAVTVNGDSSIIVAKLL